MKRFIKIDNSVMAHSSDKGSANDLLLLDSVGGEDLTRFILIEDVIRANMGMLFPGMIVEEAHLFRVTRDADMEIAEDEAGDLLQTMEEATRQRRFGNVVRVVVQPGATESISQLLLDAFEIMPQQLQTLNFFGYPSLWEIATLNRPELQYPSMVARVPEAIQRACRRLPHWAAA